MLFFFASLSVHAIVLFLSDGDSFLTLSPLPLTLFVVVAIAVGVKGGYIDSHRPSPLSSSSPLQLPLAGGMVTLSP